MQPRLHWLLAAFASLVLLPVVAFAMLAIIHAADGQRTVAEERLRDTARALALAVDRELGRTTVAMQTFATSSVFGATPALDASGQVLAEARRLAHLFDITISVIAPDGTIKLTTAEPSTEPGQRVRALDLIATVVATGEPGVGHVMRSVMTERWIIPVHVPVRDASGGVALVLGGSVDVERLHRLLAAWDLSDANFAALSDARNVIVARSDATHDQVVGRPIPPENARRISGQRAALYRAAVVDGTERVVGFQAVPSLPSWTVVVAQDAALLDAAWWRPLLTLLIGGCLALLLAAGLASLAERTILRPVRGLAEHARRLVEGEVTPSPATAPPSRIAEFADLECGLAEAAAAAASRQRAERQAAELAHSLGERTRALAEAGVELQTETERRREAQVHVTQLQKLEALGQMTGSVAHDFNNVLAAITACFRLIERRAGPNAAVQDIVRQGDRAVGRGPRSCGSCRPSPATRVCAPRWWTSARWCPRRAR